MAKNYSAPIICPACQTQLQAYADVCPGCQRQLSWSEADSPGKSNAGGVSGRAKNSAPDICPACRMRLEPEVEACPRCQRKLTWGVPKFRGPHDLEYLFRLVSKSIQRTRRDFFIYCTIGFATTVALTFLPFDRLWGASHLVVTLIQMIGFVLVFSWLALKIQRITISDVRGFGAQQKPDRFPFDLYLRFAVVSVVCGVISLLGSLALIIPGIYLGTALSLAALFIADEKAHFLEALGFSFTVTNGYKVTIFLIFVAIGFLSLPGKILEVFAEILIRRGDGGQVGRLLLTLVSDAWGVAVWGFMIYVLSALYVLLSDRLRLDHETGDATTEGGV